MNAIDGDWQVYIAWCILCSERMHQSKVIFQLAILWISISNMIWYAITVDAFALIYIKF